MILRPSKLLPVLLVPVLLYGALKGFAYYQTKETVDEMVEKASSHAVVRYSSIDTDLRGAVTVRGISVQPLGYEDSVEVDAIRIAGEDPLFLLHGVSWDQGNSKPPASLSIRVAGVRVPLASDLLSAAAGATDFSPDDPCAQGLSTHPAFLQQLGFTELAMDFDGFYRLDETQQMLEVGMDVELHDVQSTSLSGTLADVDVESFASGGASMPSLAEVGLTVSISPQFGQQALKACAAGSEDSVDDWSERLASQAVRGLEGMGLTLGSGLTSAVGEFYRSWGDFELVARPAKPLGMLSLMFVPPDQLVDTMGLRVRLNERLITDTRFTWSGPQAQMSGFSQLFGDEPPQVEATQPRTSRILVRRQFESVPVAELSRYVNREVQIQPRGQPTRVGVLKGVAQGEAEVEQSLHGGKFTVYVPLAQIVSVEALFQREVKPQ